MNFLSTKLQLKGTVTTSQWIKSNQPLMKYDYLLQLQKEPLGYS